MIISWYDREIILYHMGEPNLIVRVYICENRVEKDNQRDVRVKGTQPDVSDFKTVGMRQQTNECKESLVAGKGKETDFPVKPTEEMQPIFHLDLVQ